MLVDVGVAVGVCVLVGVSVGVFVAVGVVFDFFGCLGLIRLPDVYNRLQAAMKSVTLGTCSILFGTFLMLGYSRAGIKARRLNSVAGFL